MNLSLFPWNLTAYYGIQLNRSLFFSVLNNK